MTGNTAIVTGMIGTYPLGGVAWDYGQYAIGLERLGWEVFYLEDAQTYFYDPTRQNYTEECSYSVRFLERALCALSPSLRNRWCLRDLSGRYHGMKESELKNALSRASLLLNVSGSVALRSEYLAIPAKALIDTDPGFNHFVNYPRWDARPPDQRAGGYRDHDFWFTYAECLNRPACRLPDLGLAWHATRPPVISDLWQTSEPGGTSWTTVLTWNNFRKPIDYGGQSYGTKEMEFPRIERIPSLRPQLALEIATSPDAPIDTWRAKGWQVRDAYPVSVTHDDYRRYIQQSRGEFSVAKNLYTATHSGWFSCRSVCYLATGRPVVVQDTGFSEDIPTGEGLLSFQDEDGALAALDAVESNYARHARTAREVAAEYFDYRVVLGEMLSTMGLG